MLKTLNEPLLIIHDNLQVADSKLLLTPPRIDFLLGQYHPGYT